MKKVFPIFIVSLCFGVFTVLLWTGTTHADKGGLPVCQTELNTCNADLNTCNDDLAACEAEAQVFPGDGVTNDSFGLPGHGPALNYTDIGDGTFTDNNTGLMWEIKDNNGGIHDKDLVFQWSSDPLVGDPTGSLFTIFLDTMNNKCDGDEVTPCTTNADCVDIGNELCGHAGYRDWCIPNVKQLQSLVDYSLDGPASSVPGLAVAAWSSTSFANLAPLFTQAWTVDLWQGEVKPVVKSGTSGISGARAVRPCQ